jgi:hypothetical protein
MSDVIYKEESYAVIGGCFNVYKDKAWERIANTRPSGATGAAESFTL